MPTLRAKNISQSEQSIDSALQAIAQEFAWQTVVSEVDPYGSGNVNDTYLVQLTASAAHIGSSQFILQRVNQHVFHQPELIFMNMRTFLSHIEQRLQQNGASIVQPDPQVIGQRAQERLDSAWRMPRIIPTQADSDIHLDQEHNYWRAITLVEGAKTYDRIRDVAHARESGYALGRFHNLLSDLDPAQLHDTLPGFHITPQYLANYDTILTTPSARQRIKGEEQAAVGEGLRFVKERRDWTTVLEDAAARGELPLRSIHGDPKVDNILIDNQSARAISMIDLDTVKPGLVHYDIGDALRSCCNPAGEETADLDSVVFDINLCAAILEGYLSEAADFFTDADYAYLYESIRLIAFELGLRFFSDYLAGDHYFKTRYPRHNLQRALVQFRLVSSIEDQEPAIRRLIEEKRRNL